MQPVEHLMFLDYAEVGITYNLSRVGARKVAEIALKAAVEESKAEKRILLCRRKWLITPRDKVK